MQMVVALMLSIVIIELGARNAEGFAFVVSKSSFKLTSRGCHAVYQRRQLGARCDIAMRDRSSSYWFCPGDRVEVIEDVTKAACNLKGRVGIVVDSWEKCDVDPTCCCAEQVEADLAVRVKFLGTERNGDDDGSFEFGFNENELRKVAKESSLPFDGMSCKAFKLEQMEGQKSALARMSKARED
ncbi:hypothetical protein MHU86_11976 [Fragilaria crotonensis]|nr:hypothetical protein MHU86_11976 [Fragilaria crotonensis]